MALSYVTVPVLDFGGGIDQQSAENSIPDTFVEDGLNVNYNNAGYVSKRKGYQGFAGYIPLRVSKVEYKDDATKNLCLYFDSNVDVSSVDLSRIRNTPLIIQGRTSSANTANVGDFPTDVDSVHYYPSFTSEIRKTFATGTNTLTIPQEEHGFSTDVLVVRVAEATSLTDNSNSHLSMDSVSIDSTSFDITITYTNNTGSAFDVFTIVQAKPALTGTNYVGTFSATSGSTVTHTVTAMTHGLSNFNILAYVYQDTGPALLEVLPDDITIDSSGEVNITVTNATVSTINYQFVLVAVAVGNAITGTVGIGNTQSITITGLDADFVLAQAYLESPIGSGNLTRALPDSVVFDDTAREALVTFVNNTSSSANFYVYYEAAKIVSNKICVDASVIGSGDVFQDEKPQLTVWGFSHEQLYGPNPPERAGWVNHIDSYRSSGDNRVISGLGGNLFAARMRTEGTVASDYLLPLLYPSIRGRTATTVMVGPAFVETSDTSSRTRGYLSFDGAGEGWGVASRVEYDSNTGYTNYILICPNLTVNGTLTTIITPDADYLTVAQAGHKENEGSFLVKTVSVIGSTLTIGVENPNRDSDDFDEADAGIQAGIFSDKLTLNATSEFLPGDVIASDLFTTSFSIAVLSSSGTSLVLSGITELLQIPAGLRLVGTRLTNVIPLRKLDDTRTVENVVAGDMLRVTGLSRMLRVLHVNVNSNTNVTLVGNGTTTQITLASGDTSNLTIGQSVAIANAGTGSGTYVVADIPDTNIFTAASTFNGNTTGFILGNSIVVDETLSVSDTVGSTTTLDVKERWVPVELPQDDFEFTPSTRVSHFDSSTYVSQEFLRSSMVADNLYLTNGSDAVSKFDGTNLYRTGLIRWQPQLFMSLSTTATARIPLDTVTASLVSPYWSGSHFVLDYADVNTFLPGQEIRNSEDGAVYTIQSIQAADTGLTKVNVYVERTITGTASAETLQRTATYRYYFRLNAIDANSNVIASAVTGSEDNIVKLGEDTAVRLRLVGLPVWDIYDFDRLEVQIYRTKANSPAPYYLLASLPMSWDGGDAYIDFTDTFADYNLLDNNLDPVNSVLKGAELGFGWNRPLRSRYITSARNRAVFGNLIGDPTLDVRFSKTDTDITPASVSGDIYTLRKDNTNTGTTTDLTNVQRYEIVTSGAATISIASRTDTNFTVSYTAHGLVAGNWVYLFHPAVTDNASLKYAGWHQVATVVDADSFTVNMDNPAYILDDEVTSAATATDKRDIPVWLGTDGNYSQRTGNGSDATGVVSTTRPVEFLLVKRLANAINTVQRLASEIEGFESFVVAAAGGEFDSRQLILSQPKTLTTTMELQLPSFSGFNIFVNDILRSSGQQVSATTNIYPSRILISYPNYPEIIDSPEVAVDSFSDSAVDINPADGQEITGVITFFGDSAFGAALKDDVIIVFKQNSIYAVNVTSKANGQDPVQKIESRGLGCTAPYSIAPTRNGIMFANESGVFLLTRNLTVEDAGQKLARKWKDTVDKTKLNLLAGHHYPIENLYKLSYTTTEGTSNSNVFVYNHQREYQGTFGSWAIYDSHPSTGWCNLSNDAFMGTTLGRVFSIRRAGDKTDYRDDDNAITSDVTFKAMDFGDSGVRKAVQYVMLHFRNAGDLRHCKVLSAVNLTDNFLEADAFEIDFTNDSPDDLGDTFSNKVKTIRFSLDDRKGVYIQVRVIDDGKDENLEIAKMDIRVAGLNSKGTTQAKG